MTRNKIIKTGEQGDWLNVLGMQLKFLCTSDDTDSQYSSMINTVPKGFGAPPHSHPWDEAVYVLKGEIEFLIDDEIRVLKAGDFLLTPANNKHAFTGVSEEEALMLAFDVPGHSHKFFQDINDQIKSIPQDLAKMPEIGDRHQVTFIPQNK